MLVLDLLGYAKPDPRAFEKALAVVKDKEGIDKADVLLVAQSQVRMRRQGREASIKHSRPAPGSVSPQQPDAHQVMCARWQ